jgi:DNA-binding CsgD family transcriptional regulator
VPSATLGLVRLERREQALEVACRELAAATAFGSPRRRGLALLAQGLADADDHGLACLEEAVELLRESGAELEHARALVALGAGLRERGQGRLARQPIAQGQDLAWRLGAQTVAAWARSELLATGARPRRKLLSGVESLTPAELRTARIAADGMTNRQIAQVLFVSTKTIEAQLSQAYAKLGIEGRHQLAAALSAGT